MTARIMQSVSGRVRPLAFAGGNAPTLTLASGETPWSGLRFELHRTQPGELDEAGPLDGENALVVFLEGSVEMTVRRGRHERVARAAPGSTTFLSGTERASSRVRGSAVAATLLLEPEWFHRVGLDGAPAGFGRMAPLAGDRTMHALVSAMRDEIASGACTGRLYGESLSLAVMSYVVDRIPASCLHLRGRCSEAQFGRLTRYIRERLGDDLTLGELAAFVKLGPRQFSESFRNAFGVTPYRYVMDQRLDEAARRLASGSVGIAELALSLGFSSQSHFAAAFRKRFGETPRQFAKGRRGRTLF